MRKMCVFGASGPTGLSFVQQALARGHAVTAVVRTPAKLTHKHDNLKIIQGDVTDAKAVSGYLAGHDCVVSCLGAHGTSPWNHTKLYSTSMAAITAGMKTNNIRRVLTLTSWCTEIPLAPWWIRGIVTPILTQGFIYDMRLMEVQLSAQDVDYTVIRPPGLTNKPPTGKWRLVEGQQVPGAGYFLPRADVAAALLSVLETDQHIKKFVAVGV